MGKETEDKTTASWMKEAQKGYIRIGVLILLNKKPSHGYEIMKEINNRTKGFWQPTPGGVYPILRDLEKLGYINGKWQTQKNRRLKVYKINQSGEAILKRAIIKQTEISNNINNLFREFSRDVLNIEDTNAPIPNMPSVFSPFLEDSQECDKDLKSLEFRRTHVIEALKTMKEQLKLIDTRIAEIKKKDAKNNPSPKPQ
jgi:DNA-binding PadR family transcriptional regulator